MTLLDTTAPAVCQIFGFFIECQPDYSTAFDINDAGQIVGGTR